jgi:hypothetical protein
LRNIFIDFDTLRSAASGWQFSVCITLKVCVAFIETSGVTSGEKTPLLKLFVFVRKIILSGGA